MLNKKIHFLLIYSLILCGCSIYSHNNIPYNVYQKKQFLENNINFYKDNPLNVEFDVTTLVKKPNNIITVYNLLSKVNKDDFTSNSSFYDNFENNLKSIGLDGYLIFKAYNSYIKYNADSNETKINLSYSYNKYLTSVYHCKNDFIFNIIENSKKSRMIGMNIFGAINEYTLYSGTSYSLSFSNVLIQNGSLNIYSLNSNQVKELYNNTNIYYIVKLNPNYGKFTLEISDRDEPTIDTIVAENMKRKIIFTDLYAIILCNRNNKIIKTLYIDQS